MPRLGYPILCMALLLSFFAPCTVDAGGPFLVDTVNNSGVALRWQNDTLKWCVDEGPLSSGTDNATAIQWVVEAMNDWSTNVTSKNAQNQTVVTTTIKAEQDTSCKPGDIDSSNHSPYTTGTDKPPTIIFDQDGSIIDELMGEGSSDSIVGLSYPGVADSSGLYMTKGGFAMFNGKMLTNGKLGTGQDAIELFKASMHHEIGHLLNLDHSQVNYDIAKGCTLASCSEGNYIPTMYPELLSKDQASLTRDDKMTISWIYPASSLQGDFCTITGEIFDSNGKPLKGVNVIAASTSSPKSDARAMVSGVLYPECEGDSRYYLYGIKPGVTYQVTYEPIGQEFSGASDFEPLGSNSPQGFTSGTIETPSGETTASCSDAGQTIEMASVSIDNVTNYCADKGSASGSSQGDTQSSSKSKCSLVEGGIAGPGALLEMIFISAAFLIVSLSRTRASRERSGRS
ncbi:MAG: hypothetical protein WC956_04970 [bacterium]